MGAVGIGDAVGVMGIRLGHEIGFMENLVEGFHHDPHREPFGIGVLVGRANVLQYRILSPVVLSFRSMYAILMPSILTRLFSDLTQNIVSRN